MCLWNCLLKTVLHLNWNRIPGHVRHTLEVWHIVSREKKEKKICTEAFIFLKLGTGNKGMYWYHNKV